MKLKTLLTVALALLMASCEKVALEKENGTSMEDDANVVLKIASLDQIPFDEPTRASTNVTQLCTRINFALFQGGSRVKNVAQKEGDTNFGTVGLSLSEGTYQLAVLAHSCSGTATTTQLEKITFPDNKITDTFYYYGNLTVGSEPKNYSLELKRCVAMFRLTITDDVPDNVTTMKFYYTGGSSTFSAVSGYGSVNSRQTVSLEVADGQKTFDVFTFPKAETGELKMTVTALDASGNTVAEQVFEDVPVTRNQITRYTGSFFGDQGMSANNSWTMTADGEWDEESVVSF